MVRQVRADASDLGLQLQVVEVLGKGDFAPGSWGQALVDPLQPADLAVEKVAYSAFYMTRLEWLLRKCGIEALIVGGIIILLLERIVKNVRFHSVEDIPFGTALSIGLIQCTAMLPGVRVLTMTASSRKSPRTIPTSGRSGAGSA